MSIQICIRTAVLLAALVGAACGASDAPNNPATTTADESETRLDTRVSEPNAPASEVIEGRIVDRSPLGHGECVQQSYEIELPSGERMWVHFERCGGGTGPSFEALETGATYLFTVERGTSPNFGEDPMIVHAAPVPQTASETPE